MFKFSFFGTYSLRALATRIFSAVPVLCYLGITYWRIDAAHIVEHMIMCLLLFNVQHVLIYLISSSKKPNIDSEAKKLTFPAHCPRIDLAIIHSTTHGRYAVDTSGIIHDWPDPLLDSMRYLSEKDYVRVNKSFLVAYKVIADFATDIDAVSTSLSRNKRVFQLVLNIPFKQPIYTTYKNGVQLKRNWQHILLKNNYVRR